MSGIFISYRREDTAYIAGRLHDRLAAEFGPDRIFRDVDTMRPGADFVQKIDDAVSSCDALVAIIGDQWLNTVDKNGKRRLSNPKDWVRLEIAAALKRNILVVPVLVENARMPSEADLPAPLRRLARHHAMDLSDQRWDYEVGQLTAVLKEVVEAEPPAPPPRPAPPPPAPPSPPPREPYGWGSPSRAPGPSGPPASSTPPPWRPAPATPSPYAPSPGDGPGTPTWLKVGVPVALALVVIGVLIVALLPKSDDNSTPPDTTRTTSHGDTSAPDPGSAAREVAGPFTGSAGRLTLVVEKIEVGSDGMVFHMLVKNGTRDTLTLPASSFSVVDNNGQTYQANPFSSGWPIDLTPGETRGTVEVGGELRSGATSLKVGWGTVFGTLDSALRNGIFVPNVKLA